MKILIVGSPRSGTSSLLRAISIAGNLKYVFEPFNYILKNTKPYPFNIENSIVKICPFQTPKEYGTNYDFYKFIKEYHLEFDKTILLTRKNKEEHLLSWHKSISKNKSETYESVSIFLDVIYELSDELSIPLNFYEELYGDDRSISMEAIKKWNLPFDSNIINHELHPMFRYNYDKSII
jgi:hypothetical protein